MRKLLFLALIMLLSDITIGNCAEKYVTFGIGRMDGDTTYSIGGKYFSPDSGVGEYPFPISVLEFDIELYMASLGAGMKFADNWEISTEIRKNISSGSGVLKDSDYMTATYSGIPDIYSESQVNLDAWSAE
ncbi:MAG: hypothetical protein HC887_12150 [Desulfobacteraceae bacterium]|nr:hypothetical protein [Desulfobacteraceae bacterium]